MYVERNPKTKKELKEMLKAGARLKVFSPGPFPCPSDGKVCIEGPHYPQPHKWYATAIVDDGYIVNGSVK